MPNTVCTAAGRSIARHCTLCKAGVHRVRYRVALLGVIRYIGVQVSRWEEYNRVGVQLSWWEKHNMVECSYGRKAHFRSDDVGARSLR